MSRETPYRYHQQYEGIRDTPDEALDLLCLDTAHAGGPPPNRTLILPPTNPNAYTPDCGHEVFLVDARGSSIGCGSARFVQSSPLDLQMARLDKPDLQIDNIFYVHSIERQTLPADGTVIQMYGIKPRSGKGQSFYARAENLVPVGVRSGGTLSVCRQDINIPNPIQPDAYEIIERRYNLLVRNAWVENWERKYRVVNPSRRIDQLVTDSTLSSVPLW